jgi:hypothetical protein
MNRIWRSICLPSSPFRTFCLSSALLLTASQAMRGQATDSAAPSGAGRNWQRVEALPAQTKVHITTDHGGKTCRVLSITDDTVVCAKGNSEGQKISRSEIKHIKLAHYGRSALVGAGVGAGVGAVSGAIAGREKPCPGGQNFCLNGIGIGAGGVAAIFGVAGALLGGAVGAVTDFARGSSIYTRP